MRKEAERSIWEAKAAVSLPFHVSARQSADCGHRRFSKYVIVVYGGVDGHLCMYVCMYVYMNVGSYLFTLVSRSDVTNAFEMTDPINDHKMILSLANAAQRDAWTKEIKTLIKEYMKQKLRK